MNQTKNQYETTFIINASLEDPQIEAVISHFQEILTRNGCEIKAINKWGRKRLTYTIQKKNTGFYVNIEFEAHGSIIPQLERAYSLNESIMRYLNIRISKKMLKAREQSPPISIYQEPVVVTPEAGEIGREQIFEDEIDETEL